MKHFTNFVQILVTFLVLTSVESFPKGAKGGVKSGIKSVFKSKSSGSSSSYTTSSYGGSPFFGTTSTTTNSPKTSTLRTTAPPMSDRDYYENIRRTYCHSGSKISLEEIEVAVTCPGSGFTLQLFSSLANKNASNSSVTNNSTLENGPTLNGTIETNSTTISSTPKPTDVISTSTIPINGTVAEPLQNSTFAIIPQNSTTPPSPNSEKVQKICDFFNATCFEKMHTFVSECLTSENSSTSPFAEAYQFDLFMAEEACIANKTTQIDEWTTGLDKCLSPYFANQGETLRKTVAGCKKRQSDPVLTFLASNLGRNVNSTNRFDSKIVGCVKDKITAPSCTTNCTWRTPGCTPLTTLARNYYLESVISLQTVLDRSPSS